MFITLLVTKCLLVEFSTLSSSIQVNERPLVLLSLGRLEKNPSQYPTHCGASCMFVAYLQLSCAFFAPAVLFFQLTAFFLDPNAKNHNIKKSCLSHKILSEIVHFYLFFFRKSI